MPKRNRNQRKVQSPLSPRSPRYARNRKAPSGCRPQTRILTDNSSLYSFVSRVPEQIYDFDPKKQHNKINYSNTDVTIRCSWMILGKQRQSKLPDAPTFHHKEEPNSLFLAGLAENEYLTERYTFFNAEVTNRISTTRATILSHLTEFFIHSGRRRSMFSSSVSDL